MSFSGGGFSDYVGANSFQGGMDAYEFLLINSSADPLISFMPFRNILMTSRKGYIQDCTTRKQTIEVIRSMLQAD